MKIEKLKVLKKIDKKRYGEDNMLNNSTGKKSKREEGKFLNLTIDPSELDEEYFKSLKDKIAEHEKERMGEIAKMFERKEDNTSFMDNLTDMMLYGYFASFKDICEIGKVIGEEIFTSIIERYADNLNEDVDNLEKIMNNILKKEEIRKLMERNGVEMDSMFYDDELLSEIANCSLNLSELDSNLNKKLVVEYEGLRTDYDTMMQNTSTKSSIGMAFKMAVGIVDPSSIGEVIKEGFENTIEQLEKDNSLTNLMDRVEKQTDEKDSKLKTEDKEKKKEEKKAKKEEKKQRKQK